MSKKTYNALNTFMDRVNKLTVGRSTSDDKFGRVTLKKAADTKRGYNAFLKRNGYGTRKFAVTKSALIPNGSYTLGGLRKKLTAAVEEG